jgi:pro-kumamolisin-like protein/subtilase family protein
MAALRRISLPLRRGVLAFLLACAVPAGVPSAVAADLVRTPVDTAARSVLSTRLVGWAKATNDLGPVASGEPLERLTLVLARPADRQQAFDAYLHALNDPRSPDYHHWLDADEIGTRFGPSAHDVEAASAWLRAQGLRVDGVAASRMRIRFSGAAADVGAAFAVSLHRYRTSGGIRIANREPASVPAALAGVVRGVAGLATMRFAPQHHVRAITVPAGNARGPQPAMTNCSSTPCDHFVTPADFSTIYGLDAARGSGIDGSGGSIAIVGRARVYDQDMASFAARTGVTLGPIRTLVPPQGTDPGPAATTCSDTDPALPSCSDPDDAIIDQAEATLDVQRASSVAPGAAIKLIVSGSSGNSDGIDIALDYAIDTVPVPAKVLSVSFLSCEADNSAGVANYVDDLFAQAAMEGISVFVASGDGGVAGCASLDSPPQPNERTSTNILCASGNATCVGGTEFADTANPDAYWRGDGGAFHGYSTAIRYIPEGAWNEPLDDNSAPQVAATGGGVSIYLPTPSWQVGTGVPAARSGRYTPDVSFSAAMHDGYFGCMAARQGSCVTSAGSFSFVVWAGTSASAPDMAGVAALLDQKTGSAQGNLNPRLYALAGDPANGVFHDVTVASSGVASCSAAVPSLCNNSTPDTAGLTGGLAGYLVQPGYDEATGLGSLNISNFLTQWGNAQPASIDMDQHGLAGAWANPATPGQGFVLDLYPDFYSPGLGMLFGGWFTYDTSAAGGQRWYTIQSQVADGTSAATMAIYRTVGGRFDTPQPTNTAPVGSATLAFADCTHGTFAYHFDGGSIGSIPLTRLLQNVDCGPNGSTGAAPGDFLLSGAWYDPANSGQGLVFEVNPLQRVMFAAWYTFAPDAAADGDSSSQRWYTLQSTWSPGVHSVAGIGIYNSTGGVFNAADATTTTPVGSAHLTFTSCTNATLAWTFSGGPNAGRSGTMDLARVGPAPAGCTF